MDGAAFDRVATTLPTFHAQFAPLFGRDKTEVHSEQYSRGPLSSEHADRRGWPQHCARATPGQGDRRPRKAVPPQRAWVGRRPSSPRRIDGPSDICRGRLERS